MYMSVGNAVAVDVVKAKPPTCAVMYEPLATHENARVGLDDDGTAPHVPTYPRQYRMAPLPETMVCAVAYSVEKATRLAYTENVRGVVWIKPAVVAVLPVKTRDEPPASVVTS